MTGIEWTDETLNPTTGCDRVSKGCDNCYALDLAKRLKSMGQPKYQRDGDPRTSGPGFGLTMHPDTLTVPFTWRKPRRVFVNSMSDLFHKEVTDEFITRMFAVMAATPQHTYQILTKRPARMRSLLSRGEVGTAGFFDDVECAMAEFTHAEPGDWPLSNAWLGTSIESDEYTWRADKLRQTPAAVRFLSLEPLLGPLPSLDLTGISWVIVGGESGAGHRMLDLAWVRDIRDRCVDQQIPFFFKQVGGHTPKAGGRLLDGRTWDEFPAVVSR